MGNERARIRIGTAAWAIPRAYAGEFGEGGSVLARYATRFDAVEINSSFYRPHQTATYARWAESVPTGFRFSVKLPQEISHERALRGAGPALDRFLGQVAGLGDRLGCLLLQLPPGQAFDARVAATFFGMLRRRAEVPVACEPRHASWFTPSADTLLARYRISRAAADPARVPSAGEPGGDPSTSYFRWHGAPRIYYSPYGPAAIESLAEQARAAAGAHRVSWVIFDNTAHGFATRDALRLQARMRSPASRSAQ
ncbi:hypothetical protein ARC20_04040 [Stenotrophomonas panacihumi]|uniref:DUF72 domain-containing protein n=1 Tax=Stenotrophomonas panacihumi TaxID=676599 RepID=A0A0R0ANY0_9GAMM|nr:DUF72 domain-containing protein [Stenotrophomonas panacihumi]KRG46853.1 hypothetical protein ARC20_04040 [Stenotrophomonas panacihumi]PTN55985.1 DUF72 domain-containing protein [Stenotrophomonas panacihumi]